MTPQNPSSGHPEFDQICSRVEDWEPLPALAAELPPTAPPSTDSARTQPAAVPPSDPADAEPGVHSASLDQLILGGLVSP